MSILVKKALIITKNISAQSAARDEHENEKKNKNSYDVVINGKYLNIHKTMPTVLTGLKVKISGRLITERVYPRKTINKTEIGGFKKTDSNIIDYAIYTNKNKRGSYSVKV